MTNTLSVIRRIFNSISFFTFCIAFGFGLLAIILSIYPVDLLDSYPKIAITDTENVKFILSFTIGGIFTLSIFSYTMVMNVLDRSISNFSPRLIPLILRGKSHQVILGVSSGTIIYSLIMAIFVSSEDNSEFPSIAAPLAIAMSIFCILLFIYFIHGVSQTIHINYVLRKSFVNTKGRISTLRHQPYSFITEVAKDENYWKDTVTTDRCGYLNRIRLNKLISLSGQEDVEFKLLIKMGSFVLENEPVVATSRKIDSKLAARIKRCISIDYREAVDVIEVGFKHMVEVAVKASSPAINDPGTALTAMDYLNQLFVIRGEIPDFTVLESDKGGRVHFELVPAEQLAGYCFREMEAYMGNDPILMEKLIDMKEKILPE